MRTVPPQWWITPPRWSIEGAIAYLDEAGIGHGGAIDQHAGSALRGRLGGAYLARRVNEYLADLKRDRPDRFGAFGSLPLPDIEGSLDQIAYMFDVLELDGVSVMTNAGGSYLETAAFRSNLHRVATAQRDGLRPSPTASPDTDRPHPWPPRLAPRLPGRHFARDRKAPLQQHVRRERQTSNTCSRTPAEQSHSWPRRFAIVDEMNGQSRGPRNAEHSADTLPRLYWTIRLSGSATPCSICCDRSSPSTMFVFGTRTTPIRATRSRSAGSEAGTDHRAR